MAIKGHKTDNITTANSGLAQFFACYRINTYLDIAKNWRKAAKRYAAVLEENRKTAFRQNHIPFRGDNYTIKLFSNVLTSLNLVDPISSHKARDISLSLMSSAFCIPKSISYIKLLHGLESSLLKIPEFFLTCALNLLLSNDFESILS